MSIMIPAWVNGTLKPVDKLYAHQRGLKHKAVSVFILRGSEILMQQRAMGKYHTPGLWANTCCTHPDWQEDPAICARRRLSEELGISDVTPHHRHLLEYRADVGGGLIEHEVVDVFVAQATLNMHVAPNPDEVMNVAWIEYRDLMTQIAQTPERFTPWLKIYMTEYAGKIFGADLLIEAKA